MELPCTVGDVATQTHVVHQEHFDRFAALSGDDNPIHVDPAFAERTRFGKTVAHGMLLYGFITGTLNDHFPSTTHVSQELMFPAPTYAGEEVTVRAEVVLTEPADRRARLDVSITKADGEVVCRGQTVLGWAER